MTERSVWLTDRLGAQQDDPATLAGFGEAYDEAAAAGDLEHSTISLNDEDEWNLDATGSTVTYQHLESSEPVGSLHGLARDEVLALAEAFIKGDRELLEAQPWES